jgi:hypothetical protein
MTTDCTACGQPLQTVPTRCFSCNKSIAPGAAFAHDRVRGVCISRHADCPAVQPTLL